jgi:hypothetical protein
VSQQTSTPRDRRRQRRGSGSRARVPGPLRRLSRDRSRLLAVLLIAIVALSASGIQTAAALVLQQTLNANWRGAYDMLVTAHGSHVGTDGYLASNSLSSGQTMTLADVAKIRTVSGIEVAAPIGEVLVPGLGQDALSLNIPTSAVTSTTTPEAFRVTVTYSTDDGLGKRIVHTQTNQVVIDNTPEPPVSTTVTPCSEYGVEVDITKYPMLCLQQETDGLPLERGNIYQNSDGVSGWSGGGTAVSGVYPLQFNPVPQGITRVTLVDPAAERKLLGKAGAFLAPLEKLKPSAKTSLAEINTWAKQSDSPYAKDYLRQQSSLDSAVSASAASQTPLQNEIEKEQAAFMKENHTKFASSGPLVSSGPQVPVLVASGGAAPLTASVHVEALGAAPPATGANPPFPYVLPTGKGNVLGSTTVNASDLLNPFAQKPVLAQWPGTHLDASPTAVEFVTRPMASEGTSTAPRYVITKDKNRNISAHLNSTGFISPYARTTEANPDPFFPNSSGTDDGHESVYAPATLMPGQKESDNVQAVPVGPLPTKQLASLQSALSYVPLGAYQPVSSTVKVGGATKKLNPSVTGLGLVSPRTVAVASIASAAAWHQTAPVDAVRVRVAGISSYNPAAERKVVDVATAIQKLGFTATIVAGSSPSAVQISVAGYAFGTASVGGSQRVGTLGTVTQEWSELGAAARADNAISTATLSILGIALGSTALLLGAVQFVSVPRRRARAAVMREIGWTRGRIRRWMSAEEIPALVVVLAAAVGATLLSGATSISLAAGAIGVAVVLVTSVVAVLVGSVSNPRRRRIGASRAGRRRLLARGRSVFTFGLRQLRIHALTAITLLVATLVVAISTAGLVDVFLAGRTAAGVSLLAQFTTGQASVPQVVLGLTGLAAGIILAVLTRRIDLARRAPQWEAMRAMGWTSAMILRTQRAESVALAIPAVVLGAAVSLVGAVAVHAPSAPALAVAGGLAALLVSLAILLLRRKASAQ